VDECKPLVAGDHGASGGGDLRFGVNNKTPKRAGGAGAESAAGAYTRPLLSST